MNIMAVRWGKLYRGTPAELAIEPAIAALGLVYRTQFPGYLYGFRAFPDFFLPQLGVVIEIDDPSHERADKKISDQERTDMLESRGWKVLRCTNENALTDPEGTVKALLSSAGIGWLEIDAAKRKQLAPCMPVSKKAAQSQRREAKHAATQAKRRR